MMHQYNLTYNLNTVTYQINELVSRKYREEMDLLLFELAIRQALKAVFGTDLETVVIEQRFYAYKLKNRMATRKEKGQLGRLIVRTIPAFIPAIKSYSLREPEMYRTCRRLFQCMKAKGRLAKIYQQIR
ncbi:hypothetical protein QO202_12795 [Aeromonas caviae]|uniref:hypothetical protein n=1 Tax=Aeromonas caviae TaxID=648 RepID=UPI0026483297|nr:hypothetical protein [Aeromonas caviae]MDN6868903.1 hypothetical protein [Aeromonas caviae]